jgi:transposase
MDQMMIHEVQLEKGKIRLSVESTVQIANCPVCNQASTSIHSHYMRYPTDLAWADWSVVIELNVKRYFCKNTACPKRTFAERFPDFIASYARRTQRVIAQQQQTGVNCSARIAEYLLTLAHIGISDTTLNRLIRALPDPERKSIRVLGVDEWAKRKGQWYGTILVDLEDSAVVDLLQDRTADTLAEWLGKHPEVEIVSRDRSQTYAEGITRGAPQAIQVADRYHLLKNLSEAVFKIFQQEYALIRKQLEPNFEVKKLMGSDVEPITLKRPLTPAEERRQERIQKARQYHQQGWTQKDIAHLLHLSPKTIRRYSHASPTQVRRQRTSRLLDPFKPYLLQRWNEGCHNATQLSRELRPKGYRGSETTVRNYIQPFRQASGLSAKVRSQTSAYLVADPNHHLPTLRTLTEWVLQRPEDQREEDERILSQLSAGQAKLAESIALAREFAEIIRQQQNEALEAWFERAHKSGYRIWRNFAAGLIQDEAAVHSALQYPWSNGPTEGHINRLKCLKRMMYGRAKDDLLRKRVLWQGHRSFT